MYEHGEPGGTAGPGCSGVPSSFGGAGGGAPLAKRVPLGSGHCASGRPALRQKSSGFSPRFLNAASTNGCISCGGRMFSTMTLKYGPEAMASDSEATNLPADTRVSDRSCLRATRMSLMVRSCSRTWLMFGFSSMVAFSWCDTRETRSSSRPMASPRWFNACSSVWALTSSAFTWPLRSPRMVAILLALPSRARTWSSRLPMVSDSFCTPSSAALRCGDV
ncbi:Uncharacterised protein [Mycobacteroides abscessus subsp. abscessus]|nr:Uncharacterised protein [Mycobacteroides abscessus subsp. abscessus]